MSAKIGRNDPCYCGSGKKYKNCHLVLDEQRKSASRPKSEDADSTPVPPTPGQFANLLSQVQRKGSQEERAELDRLLAQTQPILAYLERREEIEAASTALEAHREEFATLADDEKVYLARVQALFAEDRFAPLWFTAADIRRAFDKVGYPANAASDDRFVEKLRAAIVYLSDKDCRSRLAMNLLLHLPDFVAEQRHLDAWLIQHLAYMTVEDTEGSNPFLFQMFSHGYNAWADEIDARREAFLREVGMDPARLRSLSMEEIDAWLQALQADPHQKARMEEVIKANPDQRALAVAGLESMERNSIKLLEREDARELLPPPAEVEPWLPALIQRFESARNEFPELSGEAPPDAEVSKVFADAIWPALGEMAQSIFTPERIRQLVSQLRKYRNERFAAGDKDAAGCVMGAMTSLEQEDDPARNYFLNALCFTSLRIVLREMAEPNSQNRDTPPSAESAS